MRGSGSERATAVRGSLFPPFSPLFPSFLLFLFSSMAKIGPISATNQNWVLFSEVGEAFLWRCTTQGRIGSGSQHSNAPVLFEGTSNMPRGGQRGARGAYKPSFQTSRSVENTLNTKILFILNLSDVSPVKPAGLHASQSFGLYDKIEDIPVDDIYEEVDNDVSN